MYTAILKQCLQTPSLSYQFIKILNPFILFTLLEIQASLAIIEKSSQATLQALI